MVLVVKEGCSFCTKFRDYPGLTIARVISTPRGTKLKIDDAVIDIPPQLRGFPALIDGERVYMGRSVIEERLSRETS